MLAFLREGFGGSRPWNSAGAAEAKSFKFGVPEFASWGMLAGSCSGQKTGRYG